MTPDQFHEARRKLGFTQSQMAHALGMSRQASIADKEAGRKPITRADELLINAYLAGYLREG